MEKGNTYNGHVPKNPVVCAILLERNKGFLPKAIRSFMRIWARIQAKDYITPTHNHAEIIIHIDGLGLMSVGAVKGGFRARPFLEAQPREHWENIALYVTKDKLSIKDKRIITDQVLAYSMGMQLRGYEYFNFISWPVYILTLGRVKLSKDSAKRMECYEAVARCYNALSPEYFLTPEYTDIFSFYYNDKLIKLENMEQYLNDYFTKYNNDGPDSTITGEAQ